MSDLVNTLRAIIKEKKLSILDTWFEENIYLATSASFAPVFVLFTCQMVFHKWLKVHTAEALLCSIGNLATVWRPQWTVLANYSKSTEIEKRKNATLGRKIYGIETLCSLI